MEFFPGHSRPMDRLAGQTLIYGLPTVASRFLNYLLIVLHTRVFPVGDYGIISLLYAYVSFINILFIYGLETAFFRFFNKEENREGVYATALTSLLVSSPLLTAILILASRPLAVGLNIPKHPEYVVCFALILGADAIGAIPFARLRQENRPFRYAAVRLANIGLNIGFNLFFLLLCPWLHKTIHAPAATKMLAIVYRPSIGVGYVFVANLIASLGTLLLLSPEILGRRPRIERKLWTAMMRYALPLVLVGLAGMVNETMDRIFLRFWLPGTLNFKLANIGIYSACYKLSLVMTLFIQAFRLAAEPFFFEQAREQHAPRNYARVMNYFVGVCSLIFLGVMVFIDLFKLLVGAEYRSGLGIVPVLLLANFCLGVYYSLSVWYKLTDKTHWGAAISVAGALITVGLNRWWIPFFGYRGAAWATLACYFSMMMAGFLIGQKHYFIPYDLKRLLFYPGLAIGLYLFSSRLLDPAIRSVMPRLGLHLFLVALFSAAVWLLEKTRLPAVRPGP